MVIGIPALNQHELTERCVKQNDVSGVKLIVMDNGSDVPYEGAWTYKENVGYFYPLKTVYNNYKDPIIGLMHNDVFIYDEDWPAKVLNCFAENPKLGILGLAGFENIDSSGNVSGLKANFIPGSIQNSSNVEKISSLDTDVSCVDSLFMVFRSTIVPKLKINSDILPYHWYDRIWSLIALSQGYDIGVIGIPFEHIGGQTALHEDKYTELALDWCRGEGIITDSPDAAIFKEGKRRYMELLGMMTHFS